jgi:hypothetical protein
MCRICFIIHLVPLVLVELFVCRNFGQNGDKYTHSRQVDVVGGLGATWAHRSASQGRRSGPQVPPWHWPHHQSMGAAVQALPCVDLSRFASMATIEWSWIPGSIVILLEGSNRPWNRLTYQILTYANFTTAFGSQTRPYDRKAVKSRAGRHHYNRFRVCIFAVDQGRFDLRAPMQPTGLYKQPCTP